MGPVVGLLCEDSPRVWWSLIDILIDEHLIKVVRAHLVCARGKGHGGYNGCGGVTKAPHTLLICAVSYSQSRYACAGGGAMELRDQFACWLKTVHSV